MSYDEEATAHKAAKQSGNQKLLMGALLLAVVTVSGILVKENDATDAVKEQNQRLLEIIGETNPELAAQLATPAEPEEVPPDAQPMTTLNPEDIKVVPYIWNKRVFLVTSTGGICPTGVVLPDKPVEPTVTVPPIQPPLGPVEDHPHPHEEVGPPAPTK